MSWVAASLPRADHVAPRSQSFSIAPLEETLGVIGLNRLAASSRVQIPSSLLRHSAYENTLAVDQLSGSLLVPRWPEAQAIPPSLGKGVCVESA